MTKPGHTQSPETRAKISAARRGKPLSPEHCAKLAAAHRGKSLTEKQIAANTARRGVPQSRPAATRVGHPMSAETRAKIGAANRGRTHLREHVEKMRAIRLAQHRKDSPETRGRKSAAQRKRLGSVERRVLEGYVFVFVDPPHPRYGRRAREHCLIAERALGRPLKYVGLRHGDNEEVHHINFVKTDNRPSNLLVCTHRYHLALHRRLVGMRWQPTSDMMPP